MYKTVLERLRETGKSESFIGFESKTIKTSYFYPASQRTTDVRLSARMRVETVRV